MYKVRQIRSLKNTFTMSDWKWKNKKNIKKRKKPSKRIPTHIHTPPPLLPSPPPPHTHKHTLFVSPSSKMSFLKVHLTQQVTQMFPMLSSISCFSHPHDAQATLPHAQPRSLTQPSSPSLRSLQHRRDLLLVRHMSVGSCYSSLVLSRHHLSITQHF